MCGTVAYTVRRSNSSCSCIGNVRPCAKTSARCSKQGGVTRIERVPWSFFIQAVPNLSSFVFSGIHKVVSRRTIPWSVAHFRGALMGGAASATDFTCSLRYAVDAVQVTLWLVGQHDTGSRKMCSQLRLGFRAGEPSLRLGGRDRRQLSVRGTHESRSFASEDAAGSMISNLLSEARTHACTLGLRSPVIVTSSDVSAQAFWLRS